MSIESPFRFFTLIFHTYSHTQKKKKPNSKSQIPLAFLFLEFQVINSMANAETLSQPQRMYGQWGNILCDLIEVWNIRDMNCKIPHCPGLWIL